MPRDLPLSNGSLLVAFDLEHRIRDLYFPHVGKENHAVGHVFRVGVWAEGRFAWLDGAWHPAGRYAAETMVTDVTASAPGLELDLHFEEAVDFYENVLVRRIRVTNRAGRAREVRVFFHHDFHILGTEIGDTALYLPDLKALLHYKEDRYFLINCAVGGTVGVPAWACGLKETGGKEGTWRDAEDGVLSGNPVAQGSVDSTLGVPLTLGPRAEGELAVWLAAGRSHHEVATIDEVVRSKTPAELLRRTGNYWRLWAHKDDRGFADLSDDVVARYRQSLLIVRSQIDDDGAVIAANDTDILGFSRDTYSYMWPRDGALVSTALMRAGHGDAPGAFLRFCAQVISPHGYLRHKYTPDGLLASTWHGLLRDGEPVLPIQEDETAAVVWAVWQYFEHFQRIEETAPFYRPLVTRPADFMLGYVDAASGLPRPSYDPWEERWGIHAYTVAAVIGGLRAAGRLTEAFGETERAERYRAGADRMVEGLRAVLWNEKEGRFARMATPTGTGHALDMTVDASLFGLLEFEALPPDDPQLASTVVQIERRLWVKTEIGGLARYENDAYWQVERGDTRKVPGNPWFVGTLWLARWHLRRATSAEECARGRELIEWAARHALPSGVMAEQLHPYTGAPVSVSPLTWSHAAYVRAVTEYVERMTKLNVCPACGQPVKR